MTDGNPQPTNPSMSFQNNTCSLENRLVILIVRWKFYLYFAEALLPAETLYLFLTPLFWSKLKGQPRRSMSLVFFFRPSIFAFLGVFFPPKYFDFFSCFFFSPKYFDFFHLIKIYRSGVGVRKKNRKFGKKKVFAPAQRTFLWARCVQQNMYQVYIPGNTSSTGFRR